MSIETQFSDFEADFGEFLEDWGLERRQAVQLDADGQAVESRSALESFKATAPQALGSDGKDDLSPRGKNQRDGRIIYCDKSTLLDHNDIIYCQAIDDTRYFVLDVEVRLSYLKVIIGGVHNVQ